MSHSKVSSRGLTAGSSFSRNSNLQKILEKLFSLPKMPQVDRWLAVEFAKNKKFGSTDRKWYSEQVFFIVRNLYFILYQLKYKNKSLNEFENEIDTAEKFWDAVKTLSSRDLIAGSSIGENEFIQTSIPLWLKPFLLHAFPEPSSLSHFLHLQNKRPALWIRLNHLEKRDDVLADLKKNEFNIHTTENSNALSISGEKSVYSLESFQKGFFEIQDYASQEIGNALHVKPGDYIWDACAGGGGKTIQIASQLKNKGVVYASDIRAYKLEEIKKRAKRAQFFNVRTMVWDGNTIPTFPKEILNHKGFDAILIDAPCSASGTWRRHPDAKYKIDEKNIFELTALQYQILSSIKEALKANGKLVYATCSVFKEENEDIVLKFLNANPKFNLIEMKNLMAQNENSDFMFVAVLEKKM